MIRSRRPARPRLHVDQWDAKERIIDWSKTKNSKPHAIPVPEVAAELIESITPNTHGWFFPSATNPTRPVSHGTLYSFMWRQREREVIPVVTNRDLRRTWKTLAGKACACRNSNSHVQMMKSAEKWRRQNATNGMYCSRRRRVLVDRKVRASLVIVGRVRSQQMAEMPLAEHDNVVKTFPPDRTDRPFTISVLPRRSRRGWPVPNAHRPKAADEDVTVDGVAVTNDVSRCYFPTIGLGELVRNPFSRWVRSHPQPQDLAAIVMQ